MEIIKAKDFLLRTNQSVLNKIRETAFVQGREK
jgi:hypothetical protein